MEAQDLSAAPAADLVRRHVAIIAELATVHGGNVWQACDMIGTLADFVDYVKLQLYEPARFRGPEERAAWFRRACLDLDGVSQIRERAQEAGLVCCATVFTPGAVRLAVDAGVRVLKLGHGDSWRSELWRAIAAVSDRLDLVMASWAVGTEPTVPVPMPVPVVGLYASPAYPAPARDVTGWRPPLGWSDHTQGIFAAQYVIARGCRLVEKHVYGGCGEPWQADADQFKRLRSWADDVSELATGLPEATRRRWLG